MAYFILGIAVLLGSVLAAQWYVSATPSTLVKALRWIVILGLAGLIILFLIGGRIVWALFALPVLLPWLFRFRSAARMAKNWSRMAGAAGQGGPVGGGGTGQASSVDTKFIKMHLDHDSGEMNGEVVVGRFTGRRLAELSQDDLVALLGEATDDEASVRVLTAYLDRYFGTDWRAAAAGDAGTGTGGTGSMARDEAYEILGLEPGASPAEVKAAHHRLMSKIHPDHDGSTYLASKVNQAKDLLLG